jgi:thermitase
LSSVQGRRTSILRTVVLPVVVAALFVALTGLASAASNPEASLNTTPTFTRNATGFAAGDVIVKFKRGVDAPGMTRAEAAAGAHLLHTIPQLGVRVVSVAVGHEDGAVAALRANGSVAYAERDGRAEATDTSTNDPYYMSQTSTSISQVRAPAAWDVTTGAPGFVVAVVDSGVSSHPDLAGKLLPGWDYVNNDNNPADDNGHGTMVSGLLAAATNNATGIAGLCWSCQILPVKVLDAGGSGTYSNIASGITYAADHGAKVINLSLGGSSASSTLQGAVTYAVGKGATVVAASGNNACDCVLYPAAYPNAIAVGAVDGTNVKSTYSNYGAALDVVAPGTNWATSSVTQSGYAAFAGTSSATPVVSALVALTLSVAPNLSPTQLATVLESSALDLGAVGWDSSYGAGEVDFAATLAAACTNCTPGATAAPTPTAPTSASPTPAATVGATFAPTPAPTATPTAVPTPTPTLAPTITSTTFSGSLSSKTTSRSFGVTAAAGLLTASVSTSKGVAVSLSLLASDGAKLATAQGTAGKLSLPVPAGSYVLVVTWSGTRTSFNLAVTYPA